MRGIRKSGEKRAEEKKLRVSKRNQFRRIRNKQEVVYRVPDFLKQTLGLMEVSETGVFVYKEGFSKAYMIGDKSWEEIKKLIMTLREMDIEYQILTRKEQILSLILHTVQQDMSEALEWFSIVEQKLSLKGLNAEERLGWYGTFLETILNRLCSQGSYLFATEQWKQEALMEGMQLRDGEVETDAGCFAVFAIRSFSNSFDDMAFQKLIGQEGVENVCISALPVSDQMVIDAIREEYVGLDAILPRLKRKSPIMYNLLSMGEENAKEDRHFVRAGVYFLLRASNKEEMERKKQGFLEAAKLTGVWAEEFPLAELYDTQERKRTLAMFAMMGSKQERYQSFFPSADFANLFSEEKDLEKETAQTYDIEEMRTLFFDMEADR